MYHAIIGAIAAALVYTIICIVHFVKNKGHEDKAKASSVKMSCIYYLSLKRILIAITSIVIVVFAYLLLLNGRYEVIDKKHVFDKWEKNVFKPEYKKSIKIIGS